MYIPFGFSIFYCGYGDRKSYTPYPNGGDADFLSQSKGVLKKSLLPLPLFDVLLPPLPCYLLLPKGRKVSIQVSDSGVRGCIYYQVKL